MTPFDLAMRLVGEIRELPGAEHHPYIQWGFLLCGLGVNTPDEVPWCSAGLQPIFWLLRRPRSKSAAARSWLGIGAGIDLREAMPDADVVVLTRGTNPAQGHVGLYAGIDHLQNLVDVLGFNQGNGVSVAKFRQDDVLGVRRVR